MDTIRVDICYRPLRVAWAISEGDVGAFRQAVKLSHTLWGGRFNPIVVVNREDEAEQMIDLFRVDLILPIGDSPAVKEFPKRFPYLINPFFHDDLFIGGANEKKMAQMLDVHNALYHLRDTREWKSVKEKGVRIYSWQANDPLTDVFLVQFGMYPSATEIGIDYRDMLMQAAEAKEHTIDEPSPIPADVLDYPNLAYLSRHGLKRHYSIPSGWDYPGFFIGDSTNLDDLIYYWNLRAADISLWFVDLKHIERYEAIIPAWEKNMRKRVSRRREFYRHVAVWSRSENIEELGKPFIDLKLMRCPVSIHSWNGMNIQPGMMYYGQTSALGVLGRESGKPKISFALNEKPFSGNIWFHTQHLVASISFIGGLYGDEHFTLNPLSIPELNEFYSRTMHYEYNKLRIGSNGVGFIIRATDKDTFLYALPVADLVEKVFAMAGLSSKLSAAGLITRQLIRQLNGLQGARVFKIPGVRRLLKTYGPKDSFTKKSAMQLIASCDPKNPDAKFKDYQDLYIEYRPRGTKLRPDTVFSHLVEKGLFRIGTELTCPNCRMVSWIALDALKQSVSCELCGQNYDATQQLVNGEWRYRRSGVLGAEKNAQGAVPVTLTLQQLDTNIGNSFQSNMHMPSLDLEPLKGTDVSSCEIDFVWLSPRQYPEKTVVILGECKDQGPIIPSEFKKDIENLKRVADAFPSKRFETFILISKLNSFTQEEIELAKTLNDEYRYRTILLTERELEPYHIYERTKSKYSIDSNGGNPEELAQVTAYMYFEEKVIQQFGKTTDSG